MKVIDLIDKLNSIGFDDNTEISFSCVNGELGEWHDIPFKQFNYGEDLTVEPYKKDIIDIEVDMDSVVEYTNEKVKARTFKLKGRLISEINEWI